MDRVPFSHIVRGVASGGSNRSAPVSDGPPNARSHSPPPSSTSATTRVSIDDHPHQPSPTPSFQSSPSSATFPSTPYPHPHHTHSHSHPSIYSSIFDDPRRPFHSAPAPTPIRSSEQPAPPSPSMLYMRSSQPPKHSARQQQLVPPFAPSKAERASAFVRATLNKEAGPGTGAAGALSAVARSPDGFRVAVAGRDTLKVLRISYPERQHSTSGSISGPPLTSSASTSSRSRSARKRHASDPCFLACGPGGATLSEELDVWRGSNIPLSYGSLDVRWGHAGFSNKLATACSNGAILLWDIEKVGNKCERTIWEHNRSVHRIVFSPVHANYLASASQDGNLKLWDLRQQQGARIMIKHADPIRDVVFCPLPSTPLQVITALESGTLTRWDLRMAQKGVMDRLAMAHRGPCYALDWRAPDDGIGDAGGESGKGWLASGGLDKTVKIWDMTSPSLGPRPQHTIHTTHGTLRLAWRPEHECELATLPITAGISASSEAQSKAGGGAAEAIEIWDVRRGYISKYVLEGGDNAAGSGLTWLSPDSLVATYRNSNVIQHDIRYHQLPLESIPRCAMSWDPAGNLAFALDGFRPGEVPFDDVLPHVKAQQAKLKIKQKSPADPAFVPAQVLAVDQVSPVFDTEAFAFLAMEYVVDPSMTADLGELCGRNALAAEHVGRWRTAKTWELIASILAPSPWEEPAPPVLAPPSHSQSPAVHALSPSSVPPLPLLPPSLAPVPENAVPTRAALISSAASSTSRQRSRSRSRSPYLRASDIASRSPGRSLFSPPFAPLTRMRLDEDQLDLSEAAAADAAAAAPRATPTAPSSFPSHLSLSRSVRSQPSNSPLVKPVALPGKGTLASVKDSDDSDSDPSGDENGPTGASAGTGAVDEEDEATPVPHPMNDLQISRKSSNVTLNSATATATAVPTRTQSLHSVELPAGAEEQVGGGAAADGAGAAEDALEDAANTRTTPASHEAWELYEAMREVNTKAILDAWEYYAEQGDVQMCATMFLAVGNQIQFDLLQAERVLDSYLVQLDRFQLWTVAAHIRKVSDVESLAQQSQNATSVLLACGNCGETIENPPPKPGEVHGYWYCDNCKALSGLCAICHLPVRGLHFWCQGCGHGGCEDCYLAYLASPLSLAPDPPLPPRAPSPVQSSSVSDGTALSRSAQSSVPASSVTGTEGARSRAQSGADDEAARPVFRVCPSGCGHRCTVQIRASWMSAD